MIRLVVLVLVFLGIPRTAAGQRYQPHLTVIAHGGYNFNDLNEALLGGQATFQITPSAALSAGASSYMGVAGSLWMWDAVVRLSPLQRARAAYLGAGFFQSRAANGSLRENDVGFIAVLGAQSGGRVQWLGEFQLLKDGAVSTQVLAGLGLRIR